MIDYARISTMIKYEEENRWPICEQNRLKKHRIKQNIIFLAKKLLGIKEKYNVFNLGTRGWEYPWVMEQITTNVSKNARILDCGCGTSLFPLKLSEMGYDVYGLDFFKKSVQKDYGISPTHRRKYGNKVTFIDGDAHKIPFESKYFDVLTCISVMEHIVIEHKTNPQYHIQCLKEMKRVLKPNGLLICTYDTFLNQKVVFGDINGWSGEGWHYLHDIEILNMKLLKSDQVVTKEDILSNEDAFYICPKDFFNYGYGTGFNIKPKKYYRMTSVGFVLIKE